MAALSPQVMKVLRGLLPTLTDEIVAAVGEEVPAYRRPLEGAFGEGVRRGVDVALSRFVESAHESGPALDPRSARTYIALGRGEYRQGRSLDALLAAYRVGARIAWRRITDAGEKAWLDPRELYRVGEALFSYIDALSAESAEGWASAQAAAAGETQRRRADLLHLLADDPAPDAERVAAAAADANWPLPAQVVAVAAAGEEHGQPAARLGPDTLAAPLAGSTVLLLPAPAPPAERLARALDGRAVAVGSVVPIAEAGRAIARVRRLLRLVEDGTVAGGDGPARVTDHLPALLLHADEDLARELADRELAPLDELPAASRAKLLRTLRVWLDDQGRVEQTAHHLGVHPQTVRYRVRRLRELFGMRIETPDGRHALDLALRAVLPRDATPDRPPARAATASPRR